MSVSQFKSFMDCEARTMAELKGEWTKNESTALLVGSYTHAAFESDEAFEKFISENEKKIFKARGAGKRAEFEQADLMIKTIKNDPLSMLVMEGEKEAIVTAKLFGTTWKAKLDVINHEKKRIGDLKTTQELQKRFWSVKYNGWVSFIQAYDYVLQMAVYKAMIECRFEGDYKPYIVAVTKQNPPNKAVIQFHQDWLDSEYTYLGEKMTRVLAVKSESLEPIRCEECEYCRSTKTLKDAINLENLLK
ncbi:PD-(D/E)XK nuclease-like domain-containing protein [Listeria seeligeri]